MGEFLKQIKGLAFGLLLGSVVSTIFSLGNVFTISIALLWVVLAHIYHEFLASRIKRKDKKLDISWKLNKLEKNRYNVTVQEYVTTKRDLFFEFNELDCNNIVQVIRDVELKYNLNDSLEKSIIAEYKHRIFKLINENLLKKTPHDSAHDHIDVLINRIINCYDANWIVENFESDTQLPDIKIYEERYEFFKSRMNWNSEFIDKIIKFSVNNSSEFTKMQIDSEIRRLCESNITDLLESKRFNMKPLTYLIAKENLINFNYRNNRLKLDLSNTIDNEDIKRECVYRIKIICSKYVNDLIGILINKSSEKPSPIQISEIVNELNLSNIVNDYLDNQNKFNSNENDDYSFLLVNNVLKYLDEKKYKMEEIIKEWLNTFPSILILKDLPKKETSKVEIEKEVHRR